MPRRDKTFTLAVIGTPGKVAWLGWAASQLKDGVQVPGLTGKLWLDPVTLQLMPLGALPSSGSLDIPISLPATAPLMSVPLQVLVDTELSKLEQVQVVP